MITGMAVDTMVWSNADNRNTIMTPMMVIFRSASVKWAVVKIGSQLLVHYRSALAAQHEFLNFSGCGFWQFSHEVERARNLEMRQGIAGKITQLIVRRGSTRPQH